MITPKDIENKTMSPEKRKSAKNDYFAFYVGRPLSYILTIPFLYRVALGGNMTQKEHFIQTRILIRRFGADIKDTVTS